MTALEFEFDSTRHTCVGIFLAAGEMESEKVKLDWFYITISSDDMWKSDYDRLTDFYGDSLLHP